MPNIVKVSEGVYLDAEAAESYKSLVSEARKSGISPPSLYINSGYRTREEQEFLYKNKREGVPVAKPGHSQHETGLAVDFNLNNISIPPNSSKEEIQRIMGLMRDTDAYLWLKKNASRFRFSELKSEPWHWNYNPLVKRYEYNQSNSSLLLISSLLLYVALSPKRGRR